MKILLLLIISLATIPARAITYDKEDSIKVVNLLAEARQKNLKKLVDSEMFFARSLMSLPYVAHTLEVNKNEELVVNLHQLDCTTFVENVVALTLCCKQQQYSFDSFCKNLQMIRYEKNSAIDYANRLHYFTAWIDSNAGVGICESVDSPNPPFSGVQKISVNYMSKYSHKYSMLKGNKQRISQIKKMESRLNGRQYRYIPKARILNTQLLRNTIHTGDVIAILTNKKGLDTQHIGIAVWQTDGLHLLNASSIHHKVVLEPMLLRKYLQERPSMIGIRVVRIKE